MSGGVTRRFGRWFAAAALPVAVVVHAPELLAFPYTAEAGRHRVYSETPVTPDLANDIADASSRIRASPWDDGEAAARIFLTQGGWRWRLLTLGSGSSAYAISRPLGEPIVVNLTNLRRGPAVGGPGVGGRTFSGVLAHELTHGLIRKRYGFLADQRYPRWLIEGYCDHVAGESRLSDAEALALQTAGKQHPALLYYLGRRRVAAALNRPGTMPSTLFAQHRRW